LKIVALVKCVPDTEAKIRVNADGSDIETQDVKFVMNPYDEYAVEQALRVKEKVGGDSAVTVIAMGPDRVVETLRTALAMGADEAVHVWDAAFEGGDGLANARVLAEAVRPLAPDLVFAGKQGIDYDAAQTHAAIAEFLDMPQGLIATEFTLSDDNQSVTVKRRVEGGDEVVDLKLPAVISCEKGINEPRYASLPGIMKAKKKEIKKVTLADLPLEAAAVGAVGAKTRVVKYHALPERPPVKMIPGDAAAQARELVRLLREEAKVI